MFIELLASCKHLWTNSPNMIRDSRVLIISSQSRQSAPDGKIPPAGAPGRTPAWGRASRALPCSGDATPARPSLPLWPVTDLLCFNITDASCENLLHIVKRMYVYSYYIRTRKKRNDLQCFIWLKLMKYDPMHRQRINSCMLKNSMNKSVDDLVHD